MGYCCSLVNQRPLTNVKRISVYQVYAWLKRHPGEAPPILPQRGGGRSLGAVPEYSVRQGVALKSKKFFPFK